MALILCPKCTGKLSSEAHACPRCGQPGPFGETPRGWTETPASPSAYRYETAGGYATAVAQPQVQVPAVYAAPPDEMECPVCRLRLKNRRICPRCEGRLEVPMYLPPHSFPRVPVDYATFGDRLGAWIIDVLVLLPVTLFALWLQMRSPAMTGLGALLALVVSHGYNIALTARWGQTLGKRMVNIQVRMADGAPVGLAAASLRRLPYVLRDAFGVLALAAAAATLTQADYDSASAVTWRPGMLNAALPVWYQGVRGLFSLFILADVCTFFTNKRHRTLHDFMAGTVVIGE
ncbi:MAG TPA: RDD family protein [Longimicrobiaceae bacterium]